MPRFNKGTGDASKLTADLIFLFDNSRFTSGHVLSEVRGRDFPVFSVMDTDSCIMPDTFHMYGNDDTIESAWFYSYFVAISINNACVNKELYQEEEEHD